MRSFWSSKTVRSQKEGRRTRALAREPERRPDYGEPDGCRIILNRPPIGERNPMFAPIGFVNCPVFSALRVLPHRTAALRQQYDRRLAQKRGQFFSRVGVTYDDPCYFGCVWLFGRN